MHAIIADGKTHILLDIRIIFKNYKLMELQLGQIVYHKKLYWGREPMKVVGIRENEVELEGDYSGGTHNVCQKDWLPIEGIIKKYNVK
jgi:hypothetical protein